MTVAPADTTVIVAIGGYIHTLLPWLADSIVNWLATFLAGLPIVAAIFGYEAIRTFVGKNMPILAKYLAIAHLDKWSWVINPLLGAVLGQWGFGHAGLGLVAGGVWATTNSAVKGVTKTDLKTLTKVAPAALALALLLFAGTASAAPIYQPVVKAAAPTKVSLLDASRFHYGLAMTARYENDSNLSFRAFEPQWGVKPALAWSWSNRVALQGSVWRQLSENSKRYVGEIGIGLVW